MFTRCISTHTPDVGAVIPPAPTIVVPPLRVMIFMDATWFYYSAVEGREGSCPIQRKYGTAWRKTHRIDYIKLTQGIMSNLREQLTQQSGTQRTVDLVRTAVFTSLKEDTETDNWRARMLADLYASRFEVHRFVTEGVQEKCVDIALAVEMLYMATVAGAYDVVPCSHHVHMFSTTHVHSIGGDSHGRQGLHPCHAEDSTAGQARGTRVDAQQLQQGPGVS